MLTLGKLSSLRILELCHNAFIGKEMICFAKCFPKPNSLSLSKLKNLEELKVDGAMPTLQHLEIYNCENLKKLLDELRFITTFQELKIDQMPKAFRDKVVGRAEDFYKNIDHRLFFRIVDFGNEAFAFVFLFHFKYCGIVT
ncbi:hypothetical protein PTKIN_Ptkin10aG0010000 [Pterospermum kingtungense]